jgi:polar amino acid transport system permease protein
MSGSFDPGFFWMQLLHPQPLFWTGFGMTLGIGVSAQALGFAGGLGLALARRSRWGAVKLAAIAYIWLIRGTPLLVQIMFLYSGLAAAGLLRFTDINLAGLLLPGNVQAAILALGLHESAYMAEILRAGMQAVPREEIEAAVALGAGPGAVLRTTILPRSLRLALPAIGNQFNAVLKNTTLVSVIGVSEMLLATETIDSTCFRTFELYAVLALYFLLLTSLWNLLLLWLEWRPRAFGEWPPPAPRFGRIVRPGGTITANPRTLARFNGH